MTTGISTSFAPTADAARETLSRLRVLGYDRADLQSFVNTENDWFSLSASAFARACETVRRAAADCGMAFSQTHGPWRFPPRDLTPEDRAERFDKMVRSLEGTAAVGAPVMAIHNIMPFGTEADPEPERFLELNREFFSALLAKAREYGVVVALENMPFPRLTLSTPEQVLNFVREFSDPFFRVCLDTGHAAVFGLNPGDAVRQIGAEYLACLHVHDNDGRHDFHWLPYFGVIDWADFSRALGEIGFCGTLSLETNVRGSIPSGAREMYEAGLARTARALAQKTN